MRSFKFVAVLLLATGSVLTVAQTAPAQSQTAKAPISFDTTAMDKSVDPCNDFFEFSCGGWRRANPVPGDKSRWGRFQELGEYNLSVLHGLLEKAIEPGNHSAIEQKVGNFYAACMDEKAVDALGAKPLRPEFDRIAKIKTRADVLAQVAHMQSVGIPALFGFGASPDMHDAKQTIASVSQGGLTLPDRDYYLKNDPKSIETREKYLEHAQKMLELAGEKPEQAAADAKTILAIETKLAEASMDRVSLRDPKNRDHRMTVVELDKLAPNFGFTVFFVATGAPKFADLNVTNPDFFKSISTHFDSIPVADWKTYLRWKTLKSHAAVLSSDIVNENFRFTGQYMSGQKELSVRWKRCTEMTDGALGEALGQLYVEKTFGADGKERTLKLVKAVEAAMGKNIQQLDWMSDETKKQAIEKLSAIVNNIGYPDKWKDYGTVKITRNDLVSNVRAAANFEAQRNYKKINKPTDVKDWSMTPPTVNAYYRGAMNDINFPAGILQPPFFSRAVDDAVNFGGIGAVIGHELTHGFDDQGRKFDAAGNLRDWWTEQDGKEFEKRTDCLVQQYGDFVAVKDDKGEVKLNGKLTLGENTADNGGVKIAYIALMDLLGPDAEKVADGFTPAQRFFIGYSQVWCQNVLGQTSRVLALTDPHSPGRYRVNGVVSNSPEFRKAFNCKAGDAMVRENSCRVW
ncbi:MAG TPA: M13-type metalloendopeptidase [Clostridia bacterium]|nr:M13-type metalloendopeptidase [Clostridia bacterium]